MKIDNKTIMILKNFSLISQQMFFKPGNEIATINQTKTILARAKVDVTFPIEFAIYDLSRFLAVLSLFDDPQVEFEESYCTIKSGRSSVKYVYAESSMILKPPSKGIELNNIDISFTLEKDVFTGVQKALATLQLPEISIVSDGEEVSIQAIDSKNPTSDTYSVVVPSNQKKGAEGSVWFEQEKMKIISDDYDVEVSSADGIASFKGKTTPIQYWIATKSE